MISTRSAGLVIDTVVCLTLAKWETVSGRFGGYLTWCPISRSQSNWEEEVSHLVKGTDRDRGAGQVQPAALDNTWKENKVHAGKAQENNKSCRGGKKSRRDRRHSRRDWWFSATRRPKFDNGVCFLRKPTPLCQNTSHAAN